jgi:hypothetical protein
MRKLTVTTPVYHRDFSESLILKVNAEFQALTRARGGESGTLFPDVANPRKPPQNKDFWKGRSDFVTTAVYHFAGRTRTPISGDFEVAGVDGPAVSPRHPPPRPPSRPRPSAKGRDLPYRQALRTSRSSNRRVAGFCSAARRRSARKRAKVVVGSDSRDGTRKMGCTNPRAL